MSRAPDRAGTSDLADVLHGAQVLVCAGTGGVGKTTISAALGLRAAREGRRALVLTIDPARRLADALGIGGMTDTPVEVPRERWAQAGDATGGTLQALMLDPKPTFDRLVARLTQDEAARTRILQNRIYRQLSEALAGSAEYAAMERVLEAVESGDHDLVVVDTPPSSHALDFLAAPRRLRGFLEGRFVSALLRPAMSASRFGFRVFGDGLHRMLGLIERIGGVGFIDDLSEFLSAVSGIADGFLERALAVEALLSGDDTRFVLIGGARSGTEPGTLEFLDALESLELPISAIVLNRVPPWTAEDEARMPGGAPDADALERDVAHVARALAETADASHEADATPDARRLAEASRDIALEIARGHAEAERSRAALLRRVGGARVSCHLVPERAGAVDALEGLLEIGAHVFGERGGERIAQAPAAGEPA